MKRPLIPPFLFLLAFAVTPTLTAQSSYLLTGARLIDGTGAAPRSDMQVLIVGDRIARIARSGAFAAPGGARVINAGGKSLTPGFVDLHLHISKNHTLVPPFVAAGVTAARDPGAWMERFEPLKAWQLKHSLAAPRLFLSGPHLDGPNPAYPDNSAVIRSPLEATLYVRRQIRAGATAIKVYFRLPLDSIRATAAEAHRSRTPVTAHLEILDPRDAVEAGVDGIEHITSLGYGLIPPMEAQRYRQAILKDNNARHEGRYVMWAGIDPHSKRSLELAHFLAARGIFVDPNLAVFERRPGDDQPDIETQVRGFRNMVDYVGVLHRAGVPIVVGSHSNAPHAERGMAYHREMELLVEAGMTPLEVLTAATSVGARFLGRERDFGTLREGMLADLLVLDADPSADIRNARKVRTVFSNGRPFSPADIRALPIPD